MLKKQFNFCLRNTIDDFEKKKILEIENSEFQYSKFDEKMIDEFNCFDFIKFIIVYNKNNEFIAYCIYCETRDHYEIYKIWVCEQHRRMKIARTIIDILENKEIFVEVCSRNESAISFYEGIGLNIVYIRKKYYNNQEDAIVMFKGK